MNSLSQIAPLFGVKGFINFSARAEALLGIDRKMNAATERFGVIGDSVKKISEELDALPDRIAEAITKVSEKTTPSKHGFTLNGKMNLTLAPSFIIF